MEKSATLIACEAVIIGRPAMGGVCRHSASLRDEWIIERDGKSAFIDRLKLVGDVSAVLDETAVARRARAFCQHHNSRTGYRPALRCGPGRH